MIIRKLFKFEGSHIVRNCYSSRCKYSIHGHSYKVEVKLESKTLDNAQMVLDFGLLKGTVKEIIDSFDHCHVLWSKDRDAYKGHMKIWSDRWIETPLSPSAESLAVMFHFLISKIIKNTNFCNNEGDIKVHSVTVHETDTGYAEAFVEDVRSLVLAGDLDLNKFVFSHTVMKDWTNPVLIQDLINENTWEMGMPEQQVIPTLSK